MDGSPYTGSYGGERVHFPSIEHESLDEWNVIVVFFVNYYGGDSIMVMDGEGLIGVWL